MRQFAGLSGASVSGHQAAVWLPENTLPRLEEEHRATDDAVWAGQHLAGAKGLAGGELKGRMAGSTRSSSWRAIWNWWV
ncbi:hypothetical protein QCL97_014835 [Chromobacterium amazonense]|uniref:Uncharacterized protein n=1 Tax=Chromobacterium amazonense TaxID=1382803 RepID=A0ABU8V4A2_9NEIS